MMMLLLLIMMMIVIIVMIVVMMMMMIVTSARSNLFVLYLETFVSNYESVEFFNGHGGGLGTVVTYETESTGSAGILLHHDSYAE